MIDSQHTKRGYMKIQKFIMAGLLGLAMMVPVLRADVAEARTGSSIQLTNGRHHDYRRGHNHGHRYDRRHRYDRGHRYGRDHRYDRGHRNGGRHDRHRSHRRGGRW